MMRAIKILAVFALVTPPVTGVIAATLVSAFWYARDGAAMAGNTPVLQQSFMLAAYAVPASFVAGGAQAVFAGLASALYDNRTGTLPLAVPLSLSFASWLAFSVAISSLWHGNGQSFSEVALSSNGAFLLAIHLFAGALGWVLTRRPRTRPVASRP